MTQSLQLMFIGGSWTVGKSAAKKAVVNPATEETIRYVALANSDDLDDALASAQNGLGIWAKVPAWERGAILKRAADNLRARRIEIAALITEEHGKTLAESEVEIMRGADFLEWGGEEARRLNGRHIGARETGAAIKIETLPIGVIAAFSPWNYPVLLAAKKLAALLAAGCSCVLKPAEETPGGAIALMQCLIDAGLPGDVVNLVFGDPAQVSSTLISDPRIAKVSFTGSVPVGKLLAAQAGAEMKPITMELGGHSPVVVFDDVELDKVVDLLVGRKFSNAAQICVSPNRFYVHESVVEQFTQKFCDKAGQIKLGNGKSPGTGMGPLANARRLDAVQALVRDAVDGGAELRLGGSRMTGEGFFFPPTVLANVPERCDLMHDEPFGPVVPILSFRDEAEVIARANDTRFGLAAYLFTNDRNRQDRLSEQLQAGCIGINDIPSHTAEIPLGGWKESGIGVEGGIEMTQAYLKSKFVYAKSGMSAAS